jgi:hypothetical protein
MPSSVWVGGHADVRHEEIGMVAFDCFDHSVVVDGVGKKIHHARPQQLGSAELDRIRRHRF